MRGKFCIAASLFLAAGCGGGSGGGGNGGSDVPNSVSSSSPSSAPASAVARGTTVAGATYLVGAGGQLSAGAVRVAQLSDVPWSSLPPGSQVLVAPGHYTGVTTIVAQGTPTAPITVAPYDASQAPILDNSIDFQHAAWVRVSGLTLQSPTFSGVVIRRASHHITVADMTIKQAPMGMTITDGAGTGHQLLRNLIDGSATNGIGIDVNSDPNERTLIRGNQITGSGHHGMEIRASHYQIERNTVTASGQALSGTSGIHIFSGGASEDSGDDNLVRYNASYANVDPAGVDGNGIEVDQWCDGNTVSFNLVWSNDGAGIIVYDGARNQLLANTGYDDGRDPGHTRVTQGEIVLGSSALRRSAGNRVAGNLLYSTRADVPAFYIDDGALAGGSQVDANLYFNGAGGGAVRWSDSRLLQTAAQIDAASGRGGSLVEKPAFVDATRPLADGLRLALPLSRPGSILTGLVDRLGVAAQNAAAWFGAYFWVS